MTLRRRLLPALLLLCAAAASAAPELLTGSEVTEGNVLSALEPPPLMRGFGRRIGEPPPRPPRASLLITFETASATLTAASMQQLDVVAGALRHRRLSEHAFKIEGHADPRGSHEANLLLSQRRAEAVRQYLVLRQGIAPERLLALGRGDLEPMNLQDPTAPENRRVTFATQSVPDPAGDAPEQR